MTQSNNDNKLTVDVGYSDYSIDWQNMSTSTITTTPIDTTYSIGIDDTIDLSNITFTGMDQKAFEDTMPSLDRVNNMCEEYPALQKVWRNFKSLYDMTLQDYKGKQKAGELDDEIPF